MTYEMSLDFEQEQRERQNQLAEDVREYEQWLEDTKAFGRGKTCPGCLRMAHDCNCKKFREF
ncbi:MAG: hypothetical protein MH252_21225 [Thermosynechococcaceae cyanobacterium MS004]|nr:hypothetical protein [Thermosynechococcaceae cyanobacterium MS004]